MRTRPTAIDDDEVRAALAAGWGLDAQSLEYAPVGGGSYHWIATAAGGRFFVTIDDLDRKQAWGETRGVAGAALVRAFDAARALRDQGGLEFVVAPLPTLRGESGYSPSDRFVVALYPFIGRSSGAFGSQLAPGERDGVVQLLARLHQATPLVSSIAPRWNVQLPGRARLEDTVRDLEAAWSGGPYTEPLRALLARDAGKLREMLDTFDVLIAQVAVEGRPLVAAHGEPHAGNLIRARDGLHLIDWDTMGLALPERDLWLVDDGSGAAFAEYTKATGRLVSEAAVALYRLRWRLDDLAIYVERLRAPHAQDADTERAWLAVVAGLEAEEYSPNRPLT